MVKNLILDWSGTLADDLPSVLATTNRILTHFGRGEMSREEFCSVFRLPYTEFYLDVLPEVPLADLQRLYLQHFPTGPDAVPILPHAHEFLQLAVAGGKRLVVLSSAPAQHVEHQAKALGVHSYFERLCCGVIDKRVQITALLDEMGMLAAETAFIGDMRHDIDAGKAAGVITVATATGYDSMAALLTSEPDVLVPDLSCLPRLLGFGTTGSNAPPIATVGALIVNDHGELLMIRTHKWSHRWGIPGGKIKRGETSEAALSREIQEETALDITDIRFVLVQDCIEPPEFERSAHFLLMNYVVRCVGDPTRVILNDEAEAFQWLPTAAALQLDLNEPTRILIEEALRRGFISSGVSPE